MTEADRTSALRDFGDVFGALDRLPFPIFAIASNGVIRWLNMSAEQMAGDKRGEHFLRVVAPESRGSVSAAFASKVVGGRAGTDYEALLLREDGTPVSVEVCSVPVDGDGRIVGVFGAITAKKSQPLGRVDVTASKLTPRQAEALAYLARGYTTDEIAEAMGVTTTTVRNHIRGLLKRLNAHSRLEAVATARVRGFV